MDATGDRSKVLCCKEQYCIGTWNVRPMNHGKLEVVKQEMARVNIDILGISELKWTGMGEFNSDDHYIYYCRQESLRRNGVAIMVNKSPKCSTSMQFQKRQNDLFQFALIHGPDIPGSYVILLFTAWDLASITSHIHNWVFGSIPSFFLELFLH